MLYDLIYMSEMDSLMINFMLCQKKTDDTNLVLPADINWLICQNLVAFIKHEQREADYIYESADETTINHRWVKDEHTHRDCDLPAFVKKDIVTGETVLESWWQNEVLSRDGNKPAAIFTAKCRRRKYIARIYAINGIVNAIEVEFCSNSAKFQITDFESENIANLNDMSDLFDKYIKFNVAKNLHL